MNGMRPQSLETDATFSRRYGGILQCVWMYSDGSHDLARYILENIIPARNDLLEKPASERNNGLLLRPLTSTDTQDSVLWVERYHNLQAWCHDEILTQRSSKWFGLVTNLLKKHEIKIGRNTILVDDTIGNLPFKAFQHSAKCVQILRTRAQLPYNLMHLPRLVQELTEIYKKIGFTDCIVRFYGMPTAVGDHRTEGNLWIEYPSLAHMNEALMHQKTSLEISSWYVNYLSKVEEVLDHKIFINAA